MLNLKRYDFLGCGDCASTMELCGDGQYVKFDDIKELLNSSDKQQLNVEKSCLNCAFHYDNTGHCSGCDISHGSIKWQLSSTI